MSAEHAFDLRDEPRRDGNVLSRLADVVRSRPLVAFFVLAYGLSWTLSVQYLFTRSGPMILSCGPFLAAAAVLTLTSGRPGLRALFRSMLNWRVGVRWWAVALLLPIVMTAAATALNVAFGAPTPSADDLGRWTNVLPVFALILLVPLIGGAWEEPGWRGFALPRLLAERPALSASLVLGALWSLWHLPVLAAGEQEWSDLVLVVSVTIVLTWLFAGAAGSVLIAMAFHAMNNAFSGEYASQMFEGNDSVRQSWMLVVVWTVAAIVVVRFAPCFRRTGKTWVR